MERKIKFVLIGLIGVLLVFIFLYLQTLNVKQLLMKERDDLKDKNTSLSSDIKKLESRERDYEDRLDSLGKELDRASKEKQETEKKLELANRAKEQLVEKLRSRESEAARAAAAPQPEEAPLNTDAYWGGILKAKTDLELQLDNLRSELKSMQINNEGMQREKSALELDVNSLNREKEDLKRQLEYNQKLMDSIAQELVREKNDKMQIQDSFKLIKNENTVLSRQLKSLNNRKADLEKKVQGLQEEKSAVESRLNEMEAMLTDKVSRTNALKEKIDVMHAEAKTETQAPSSMKESVELPPIVVRPQSESEEPAVTGAPSAGKILAVNEESSFVIINLGEDSGIKAGDAFKVYREGKAIASIEVIQTRKNIAACDIKKEATPIRIGDAIK